MIYRKVWGTPFPTETITAPDTIQDGGISLFDCCESGDSICLSRTLSDDDQVFGLGENVRGINKRGWIYQSACLDIQDHLETTSTLYSAHNFLLIDSPSIHLGLFIDFPAGITYDIGYTRTDLLQITIHGKDTAVCEITGESAFDVIRQFRHIIGRSYFAPRWAFGYHQSRWGYGEPGEIDEIIRRHEELDLPLDAIGLDIDCLDNYKDFCFREESVPGGSASVRRWTGQGIHLVPIVDAGVRKEEGYSVYDEGAANDYFCKRADGSDFVIGVWPGRSVLPDFLNPAAEKWFGSKYAPWIDMGIDGFWNDMNEPTIFYSEESLENAWDRLEYYRNQNLDAQTYFEILAIFKNLVNNPDDYRLFFHNTPVGRKCDTEVHNLYGYTMTRAAAKGMEAHRPGQRFLLFSRSSCIGMHRYAGIWTGDNKAWWSHLLLSLKMMPSLNMCGFLYTGSDIGGFLGDTTEDLMLRWMAFGIFTPLMRNHAHRSVRRKELYRFPHVGLFRDLLKLRYALIPFLYSEYAKAVYQDDLLFVPLAFRYPKDRLARETEDQLLIGDTLMIAPVVEQNASGRVVYLPEDMLCILFYGPDRFEMKHLKKGHHYLDVPMGCVPVFLRPGRLLLLAEPANRSGEVTTERFHVFADADRDADYTLYEDDGIHMPDGYESSLSQITLRHSASGYEVREADADGTVTAPHRQFVLHLPENSLI